VLFKSSGARGLVLNDTVPSQVVGDWLDIDNGKAEIQRLPIRRFEWKITNSTSGMPQPTNPDVL